MFKFIVFIATVLAYLGAVPQARAQAGFDITSLDLNGSGCPLGSATYTLSSNKDAVTITFSKYFAQVGPGIPISDNRKNCNMVLGVRVPSGFTFGIANVDYRGFYKLDDKVEAIQNAIYYFQGNIPQATARRNLTGPINGANYTYRDTFNLATTILSPCGADTVLIIGNDIQASNEANKAGSGYIAIDTNDISLTQKFNFQWQKC